MNQTNRIQRLMPDGIPKYIRIYDNQGKTLDRYTIVFTGNYNNIGKKRGDDRNKSHLVIGMSENPYHALGFCQHMEYPNMIDRPAYGHLGKKIKFQDLPKHCQNIIINDYKTLWDIKVCSICGKPFPPMNKNLPKDIKELLNNIDKCTECLIKLLKKNPVK